MVVAESSFTRAGPGRRVLVAVLAGAVLAGLLGWLLAPAPSAPGPQSTGDPELAQRLRAAAGPGQYGLVAALVEGGDVTYAGIGHDGRGTPVAHDTPFEIGSVTKTVTGAVLAGLERDGVVRGTDRVREIVPEREWGGPEREWGEVGDVTLGELAAHLSGLPREPGGVGELVTGLGNLYFGLPVAAHTPQEVLDIAAGTPLGDRGEPLYSNLANSLLGQLLATRSGTPYPELVAQYVTGPLAMSATGIPSAPPAGAAVGHDESGNAVAPWISEGDAPSGTGVWSTATDLVRYTAALEQPGSPVADAAQPRYPSEFGRIGYGWYTVEVGGHTLLWKNGGSGGVSSSVLADPATGRAAIVLGNSTAGVDRIAAELLGVPPPFTAASDDGVGVRGIVTTMIAVVFPLLGGSALLGAARGGWSRTPRPVRRSDVVSGAGTALFFLVIAWTSGAVSWAYVPFWMLGCLLAGAGLGLAVARRRSWESDRGPGAAGRWTNAGFSLVLGVGGLAAVVGTSLMI